MLRTPYLVLLTLLVVYLVYNALPLFHIPWSFFTMSTAAVSWLDQCTPYPDPHAFTPERSNLALAVLRNAPVETEGFTLALFGGDQPVAVTYKGQVLSVPQAIFDDILGVASRVKDLPDTGEFRNTWVIKQDRTSQAIDRIFIVGKEEEKEVSVQGFDYARRVLRDPVEGYTALPDSLWDLTSRVLEARKYGESTDDVVLEKVRRVVEQWF